MKLRIDVKKFEKVEIDVKRFYLPGHRLESKCPKCAKPFVRDFGADHLSYPTANVAFDYNCWCPECDHEWTVPLRLNVTLELA